MLTHLTVISMVLTGVCYGLFFDCRRTATRCKSNEVCDRSSGLCNCIPTTPVPYHYCILPTDSDCGNTSSCFNDGICLTSQGNRCICPDSFTGDSCEYRRLNVECASDAMTVTVRPSIGFKGIIYARKGQGNSKCSLTSIDNNVYNQTFLFTESICGMEKNNISEATQYSMDVIIQYNTDFIVNTDQSLRAICTFNTSWNLGVRVGEVNASSDHLEKEEIKSHVELVTLYLLDSKGDQLLPSDKVKIGDNLTIVVSLKDNTVFDTFKIFSTLASNGENSNLESYKQLELVKNSCLMDKEVILNKSTNTTSGAHTNFSLPLSAFKFVDKDVLEFLSTGVLCDSKESSACNLRSTSIDLLASWIVKSSPISKSCLEFSVMFRLKHAQYMPGNVTLNICQEDCSPSKAANEITSTPPDGIRLKRAVHQKKFELRRMIHVGFGDETDNDGHASADLVDARVNMKNCWQTIELQVILTTLAVAVFVLLIVSVVFSIRSLHNSNRKYVGTLKDSPQSPSGHMTRSKFIN